MLFVHLINCLLIVRHMLSCTSCTLKISRNINIAYLQYISIYCIMFFFVLVRDVPYDTLMTLLYVIFSIQPFLVDRHRMLTTSHVFMYCITNCFPEGAKPFFKQSIHVIAWSFSKEPVWFEKAITRTSGALKISIIIRRQTKIQMKFRMEQKGQSSIIMHIVRSYFSVPVYGTLNGNTSSSWNH